MNSEDETLKKPNGNDAILQTIYELAGRFDSLENRFDGLEKRFDGLEKRFDGLEKTVIVFQNDTNAKFETIREGIVHNSVAFDRLQSSVYLLSASVKELTEEVRHGKKVLI